MELLAIMHFLNQWPWKVQPHLKIQEICWSSQRGFKLGRADSHRSSRWHRITASPCNPSTVGAQDKMLLCSMTGFWIPCPSPPWESPSMDYLFFLMSSLLPSLPDLSPAQVSFTFTRIFSDMSIAQTFVELLYSLIWNVRERFSEKVEVDFRIMSGYHTANVGTRSMIEIPSLSSYFLKCISELFASVHL